MTNYIYISGHQGSGKSRLAHQIAKKVNKVEIGSMEEATVQNMVESAPGLVGTPCVYIFDFYMTEKDMMLILQRIQLWPGSASKTFIFISQQMHVGFAERLSVTHIDMSFVNSK